MFTLLQHVYTATLYACSASRSAYTVIIYVTTAQYMFVLRYFRPTLQQYMPTLLHYMPTLQQYMPRLLQDLPARLHDLQI